MPNHDVAVSVRGLSKSYAIAHNAPKHTTFGEAIVHTLKNPRRRPETETFWALRDVEFDIRRGDVVGIIGRNGAGKSTLLKILSRITEPTTGQIDIYGRVGSLLEVGTGFHPELTGRENISMNGAILGMSRREIAKHFDDIVEFAEVAQFLDTPVKRYSSGMYVRLAFAVAAHLNPEILIVDEVLAVGDAEFQKKCLGKMKDVSQQDGRTVLFVSHNMAAVTQLCDQAIMMKSGTVLLNGPTKDAVANYLAVESSGLEFVPQKTRKGQLAQIISARIKEPGDGRLNLNEGLRIDTLCAANEAVTLALEFIIRDERGNPIIALPSGWMYGKDFSLAKGSTNLLSCHIPRLPLAEGTYTIDIALAQTGYDFIEKHEVALQFEILVADPSGHNKSYAQRHGQGCVFVNADFSAHETDGVPHNPNGPIPFVQDEQPAHLMALSGRDKHA